jgi:hypothetical protein|tara:strand:+ start:578 stop:718 length:141 start_codon:yes stop_codon:yes gene_type:complete
MDELLHNFLMLQKELFEYQGNLFLSRIDGTKDNMGCSILVQSKVAF